MVKKDKKKRVRKVKKPQPLPRSVKALLGYLSGTDVKLSSSAPQRAMISQDQQFQQLSSAQSQFIPREKPVGQIISASPLAKIIPPRPTIPYQPTAQAPQVIIQKQKEKEEPSSTELVLIRSKIQEIGDFQNVLLKTASNFQQRLIRANEQKFYQSMDNDILDNEIPATLGNINEPELLLERAPPQRSVSAPRQMKMIEIEPSQGAYIAGQYISSVASPEMTAKGTIKKGRPALSEEQKKINREQRKAAALQEGQTAVQALGALTASVVAKKTPSKRTSKAVEIPLGIDPSSQISALASRSPAPESRGKSILEFFGTQKSK